MRYASIMENRTTLQTVERAISFLEYVATASEPPHIKDVSENLRLNITTCYHLLRTLAGKNYIKRRSDGKLELGDGIGVLFRNYRRATDTDEHLAEAVKRLSAVTFETAFLSLKEDRKVVLKVLVEGSRRVRVAGLFVGLQGSEYRRASGKAVLAHLDEGERAAMLEASLEGLTAPQKKQITKGLEKEIGQIKARGYAVDEGETEEGIIAIGAPFFDADGHVIGALGIVSPVFRMEKSRDAYVRETLAAAADASQFLKSVADA